MGPTAQGISQVSVGNAVCALYHRIVTTAGGPVKACVLPIKAVLPRLVHRFDVYLHEPDF